jgi:hypothetical protein
MAPRIVLVACALLVVSPLPPSSGGDEPKESDKIAPAELALEVNALRTLYYLKATPEQAQALLKIAKDTAAPNKKREAAKVSAEYKNLLAEVRDALADDDEERVESLEDQLEELTLTESPELDDDVDLTDAARKHAPKILKQFKAPQVACFIGALADQVVDPRERLLEALDKVRGWRLVEWQEQRDSLGDQIGLLVGGVERATSGKVRDAVIDLLARARTLNDDEFDAKRGDLEREAEQIVAKAGPTDVLRHLVEHALAELLSNPRLEEALKARAK